MVALKVSEGIFCVHEPGLNYLLNCHLEYSGKQKYTVWSQVREHDASISVGFLKIALAICGLIWFHINLRIICSSSVKTVMEVFIGITLHL